MFRAATRLLQALIIMTATCLAGTVAGAPLPALADGGLDVSSTYSYTIDPEADAVHVIADLTFTNVVPNRTESGYINKTYFKGFSLAVPAEATGLAATQNGNPLTLTEEATEEDYRVADVDFASNLFYRSTANVRLTYDIVGGDPRSDDSSRINDAYASFNAYGIADPGKLTLVVVVPPGYEIETFGDEAVRSEQFGGTVYTATDISQPQDFNMFISARNDQALERTDLAIDGHDFIIRWWPGDEEWKQFVSERIEDNVPALAELIGVDWPLGAPLQIRESLTPYLYGYAGWFSGQTLTLEIGEDLDPEAVAHELSHAWFNGQMFVDRWLNEGLAETYAAAVIDEPDDPTTPTPVGGVSFPLDEWTDPGFDDSADDSEEFGYSTSWFVVDALVDDVGFDKMREVFQAANRATLAYVGDGDAERTLAEGDWRRSLDLFEELAGSTVAVDLYRAHVVRTVDLAELDQRAEARVAYQRLQDAGGEWAAPLLVREAMSAWDFDEAQTLIDQSLEVLAKRDAFVAQVEANGLAMPSGLEAAYEGDQALDEVAATFDAAAAAVRSIVAAEAQQAGTTGFAASIGALGSDAEAVLAEARASFDAGDAGRADELADQALTGFAEQRSVGEGRIARAAVAMGVVVFGLIVLTVIRRRRKRRPPPRDVVETSYMELRDSPTVGF